MLAQVLMRFECCWDQVFELKSLLEFTRIDKDVDLRTLIVKTEGHYFCLFFLFNSNTLFLLSSSTMSNDQCKSSLFSKINKASSAHLNLFSLCPTTLIPGYPRFCINISL